MYKHYSSCTEYERYEVRVHWILNAFSYWIIEIRDIGDIRRIQHYVFREMKMQTKWLPEYSLIFKIWLYFMSQLEAILSTELTDKIISWFRGCGRFWKVIYFFKWSRNALLLRNPVVLSISTEVQPGFYVYMFHILAPYLCRIHFVTYSHLLLYLTHGLLFWFLPKQCFTHNSHFSKHATWHAHPCAAQIRILIFQFSLTSCYFVCIRFRHLFFCILFWNIFYKYGFLHLRIPFPFSLKKMQICGFYGSPLHVGW
jgi:hypothetical protein